MSFVRETIEVEEQTPEFYVNDFANLFTEEQKQEIISKAVELSETYNGIQVVVSTVESIKGNEIEEYAYSMYNQYGIGKDSMGILILLSTTDRDVRIETGYHMQKYITDSMSGRILDKYGMEYFKSDEFAQGLISVQSAMINEIKEIVPADWETIEKNNTSDDSGLMFGFFIFIFSVAIIIIVYLTVDLNEIKTFFCVIFKRPKKPKKKSKLELKLEERDNEWQEKLNQKQEEFSNSKRKLENTIKDKDRNISRMENTNSYLENKISEFEEKFERIKRLHPNIEKEIQKQIDDENMQKALKWDESVRLESQLKANKNNINSLKKVIDSYNNLPNEQKCFVKTDIEDVKNKYMQSIVLKDMAIATPVGALILACCNKFKNGNHSNYSEIAEAYEKYSNLTETQKNLTPNKELVSKFIALYKSASEDNNNYNKAKEAEKTVRDILERVRTPDRDDVTRLRKAKRCYNDLSTAQKEYFPQELYEEVKKKLRKAEEDDDEYQRRKREEEEERRYSSSDDDSSNHFSRIRRKFWRRWCK